MGSGAAESRSLTRVLALRGRRIYRTVGRGFLWVPLAVSDLGLGFLTGAAKLTLSYHRAMVAGRRATSRGLEVLPHFGGVGLPWT